MDAHAAQLARRQAEREIAAVERRVERDRHPPALRRT